MVSVENYPEVEKKVYNKLLQRLKKESTDYSEKILFDAVNLAVGTVHNEEIQAFNIKTKNGESGYCSQCGQCCKEYNIILRLQDIAKLNQAVDLKQNLMKEGDLFKFKDKPCRYQLNDGRCGCYEHRPITCKNHPLTNHEGVPRIIRDPDCDFCVNFFIDKSISLLTGEPFK